MADQANVVLPLPAYKMSIPSNEVDTFEAMTMTESPEEIRVRWDKLIVQFTKFPSAASPGPSGEVLPAVQYADLEPEDARYRLILGLRARYSLINRLYFFCDATGDYDSASFLKAAYGARLLPSSAPLLGDKLRDCVIRLSSHLSIVKGPLGEITDLELTGEFVGVGVEILRESLGDVRGEQKLRIIEQSLLRYVLHYKFEFFSEYHDGSRIFCVRFPYSPLTLRFYQGEPCIVMDNDIWTRSHPQGVLGTLQKKTASAKFKTELDHFFDAWNAADGKTVRTWHPVGPSANFLASLYLSCYTIVGALS